MLMKMDNIKILECEREYSKCFSKIYETEDFDRFRDSLLPDMYYHNFLLIKNSKSDDELYRRIEGEILVRRTEGEDFCNIVSFVPISDNLLQRFSIKPQVTFDGYYMLDVSKIARLTCRDDCTVSKVNSLRMAEDILHLDLEHDRESLGYDFCKRRVDRRKDVYLSAEGVDSYVCYANNKAVGNCDLFIYNDIAKIEDFAVSPSQQRQGFGTSILKSIIDISLSKGVTTIYLVANEDDTAKEMYLKLGFNKIGEKNDLLFTFAGDDK